MSVRCTVGRLISGLELGSARWKKSGIVRAACTRQLDSDYAAIQSCLQASYPALFFSHYWWCIIDPDCRLPAVVDASVHISFSHARFHSPCTMLVETVTPGHAVHNTLRKLMLSSTMRRQ